MGEDHMDDFADIFDGGLGGAFHFEEEDLDEYDETRPALSPTARVCRFRWASRPR